MEAMEVHCMQSQKAQPIKVHRARKAFQCVSNQSSIDGAQNFPAFGNKFFRHQVATCKFSKHTIGENLHGSIHKERGSAADSGSDPRGNRSHPAFRDKYGQGSSSPNNPIITTWVFFVIWVFLRFGVKNQEMADVGFGVPVLFCSL